MLTVKETATLLKVSEKTIYRWVNAGTIPSIRVGGHYRFPRGELYAWAEETSRTLSLHPAPVSSGSPPPLPSLHEAIARGGVHFLVEGRTREEVIREAVSLISFPSEENVENIQRSILAREEMGSTGVGEGIAIPHMRIPSERPIHAQVSLCFLAEPVEWKSIDGRPVTLLFLPCCPSLRAHLHLMTRISFVLRDPRWAECLATAPGRRRILDCIAELETSLRRRK